jgi:hypothetical protein
MRRTIFAILLLAGFIAFAGTIEAQAQSNLVGTYYFDMKIDDGTNNFRLLFDLQDKGIAVYRNEQNGEETQKRVGTWSQNKRTKQITVIMPPVKRDPIMGQEKKLTFVFKLTGKNLQLIKDLPYNDGKNEIYTKLEN